LSKVVWQVARGVAITLPVPHLDYLFHLGGKMKEKKFLFAFSVSDPWYNYSLRNNQCKTTTATTTTTTTLTGEVELRKGIQ